jgi:MarR-like DNA-binding transcriptional regulator SgrR of sgrS sRNA
MLYPKDKTMNRNWLHYFKRNIFFLIFIISGCNQTQKEIITTQTNGSTYNYDLSPEGADYIPNYLILDQINSSLFKVDLSGSPEPFAVEKWTSSEDSLEWVFTLKNDLKDGNNKDLKPTDWKDGIQKIVKRMKSPEKMILLSKLHGWNEYINGKIDFPITCNDKTRQIIFKFKQKPEGILEYLTMPILGFWKFDSNGNTQPTGKYFVKSSSKGEVNLQVHEAFKGQVSAEKIRVKSIEVSDCEKYNVTKNEILIPSKSCHINSSEASIIKSTPSLMAFVEINTSSQLINEELRGSIYQTLIKIRELLPIDQTSELKTTSIFYDYQVKEKNITDEAKIQTCTNNKLKVITNGSITGKSQTTTQFIIDSIKETHKCDIDLVIISDSKEFIQAIHDRSYDIRIGSVDAGTNPGKWVTEMMFCTRQGISFLDPENDICVKIKSINENDTDQIGSIVNKSLSKHKHIIPLYNKSFVIYTGNEIDTKSISTNTPSIRLDLVRVSK